MSENGSMDEFAASPVASEDAVRVSLPPPLAIGHSLGCVQCFFFVVAGFEVDFVVGVF